MASFKRSDVTKREDPIHKDTHGSRVFLAELGDGVDLGLGDLLIQRDAGATVTRKIGQQRASVKRVSAIPRGLASQWILENSVPAFLPKSRNDVENELERYPVVYDSDEYDDQPTNYEIKR